MPDLRVGNTQVSNVKVGSTQVEAVYVGSNLVWSNIVLTTSPSSGASYVTAYNDATGSTGVGIFANKSVSWSFNLVGGSNTFTTGSSSGTSTSVGLSYDGDPISTLTSVVDVTATYNGASVTTRVTVSVHKDIDVNENP